MVDWIAFNLIQLNKEKREPIWQINSMPIGNFQIFKISKYDKLTSKQNLQSNGIQKESSSSTMSTNNTKTCVT